MYVIVCYIVMYVVLLCILYCMYVSKSILHSLRDSLYARAAYWVIITLKYERVPIPRVTRVKKTQQNMHVH